MTAPPLVVDVVPPPDLPPVRPRSRAASGVLVALVLAVVTSLGMMTAAPRANAWVLPVAKGVASAVVSVVTVEGFNIMNDDGDDSDEGKKKRGKWGDRLKGLPGLAVGIIGGMFGADELGEFIDGIRAPEDMAADVTTRTEGEDAGENQYSGNRVLTIESATWDDAVDSQGRRTFRLASSITCAESETSCNPPTSGLNSGRYDVRCVDVQSGERYSKTSQPVYFNGGGRIGYSCNHVDPDTGRTVIDAVESVFVRIAPNMTFGLRNPARFFNPHLDADIAALGGAAAVDPTVTVTATGSCQTSTGDVVQVTKTTAGADSIPVVQCPAGTTPKEISWESDVAGQKESLGGIQTKTPDAYPDCPPGQCSRVISIDGQPCFVGRQECYDWMRTEPPSRVKCEYGPYNMPLFECADLEHIHKTTHGVTQDPRPDTERVPGWLPSNPDGTVDWTRVGTEFRDDDNPDPTYRPPGPGPVVRVPATPTDPENPPSTAPSNPPTTGSVPPPVWNPPTDVPDPENPTKNCIAGMASWNPVHWVFIPVKCALSWAFIPPNGTGGDLFGNFRQKFTDSGIGPWLAIPPLLFGDLPQGSGCMGPPLNMPASLGGETYYPLNACSDPMAKYANMSRSLITIVVVFYGMFSVINSLTTALTGYRMFERESADYADRAVNGR